MKSIFDKSAIKDLDLKNRLFKGAVWEELAREDGHMTDELFEIYEELAKGGVGAIFTGYAYVCKEEQPNPRMMGIYDDSFIKEYKELTDMVHSHDSKIIMQIVYGGTQSNMGYDDNIIFGPSAIRNEISGIMPKEMTKDDIEYLVNAYANAALRVKKAGFDGVAMHGAHGYLLSQFLCPHYNQRSDEYGGSIENRMRIIVEIYENIREKVGKDYPVFMKINSQDFFNGGLSEEESIKVIKALEEKGLDCVEISGGNESTKAVLKNNLGPARKIKEQSQESYFKGFAKKLRREVNIPIILTGGNRSTDLMEELLNKDVVDYFGIARPFIYEPDLANKWAEDKNYKAKCKSCNGCYHTYGKRCVFNKKV